VIKEQQDQRDKVDRPDQLDQVVTQDLQVQQACQVLKELLVAQVLLEHQEQTDHLVSLVLKVCKDPSEQLEAQESLV